MLSVDEGTIYVELPKLKKECEDKNILCGLLDLLCIDIKIEGLKTIKMTIKKPLIAVDLNKVDAELLKELQLIALNKNLELKSSKIDRNNMQFEFKMERLIDLHKEWINKFEKDIGTIHGSIKQVQNLSCFKDKQKKK